MAFFYSFGGGMEMENNLRLFVKITDGVEIK